MLGPHPDQMPNVAHEIFVVEGLSAAQNLQRVCQQGLHTVLALQGKPLNALKASSRRVEKDPFLRRFRGAINKIADTESEACDDYLTLLFDPDADGIHCSALIQIYLHTHRPDLIDAKRVLLVRAPSHRLHLVGHTQAIYAYSSRHFQQLNQYIRDSNEQIKQSTHFKGIASLEPQCLFETCVDRRSRQELQLSRHHTQAAVDAFS